MLAPNQPNPRLGPDMCLLIVHAASSPSELPRRLLLPFHQCFKQAVQPWPGLVGLVFAPVGLGRRDAEEEKN